VRASSYLVIFDGDQPRALATWSALSPVASLMVRSSAARRLRLTAGLAIAELAPIIGRWRNGTRVTTPPDRASSG
jgi:hypothetical protein